MDSRGTAAAGSVRTCSHPPSTSAAPTSSDRCGSTPGRAGPTRGQARGPGWRRRAAAWSSRPRSRDRGATDRRGRGAAARRRGGDRLGRPALGGRDLVRRHGRRFAAEGRPAGHHPRGDEAARVLLSQEFLAPYDIRVVDGLPVTSRRALGRVRDEVRRWAGRGRRRSTWLLLRPGEPGRGRPADRGRRSRDRDPAGARRTGAGRRELLVAPRDGDARGLDPASRARRPRCNAPVFTSTDATSARPTSSTPCSACRGVQRAGPLSSTQVAEDVKRDATFRGLGLEPVTMVASDWGDVDDFVAACSRRAVEPSRGPRRRVDPGPARVVDAHRDRVPAAGPRRLAERAVPPLSRAA